MNPSFIRLIAKNSVRHNQVLSSGAHQASKEVAHAGFSRTAWFGTMAGVGAFLVGTVGFLNWCYTDSKMEQIFKKERTLGGTHN